MPDGVADFTSLALEEVGTDRVRLTNMSGTGRPDLLKVVVGYEDGWIGEGMLFFPWPSALARAEKARDTLIERFERLGLKSEEIQFDFVGVNMHGPAAPAEQPAGGGGLRLHPEPRRLVPPLGSVRNG
jgi:hypothetical protein